MTPELGGSHMTSQSSSSGTVRITTLLRQLRVFMSHANETESSSGSSTNRFREPPLTVRDGVDSWTTTVDPPTHVDAEVLSTLRERMRQEPLSDALTATFSRSAWSTIFESDRPASESSPSSPSGSERPSETVADVERHLPRAALAKEFATREALFVDPADAWRIPVGNSIDGRCLDVNAGVGTRSLLLAELAETVDAVDTELAALSFLNERDDYASRDRVTPVHAELSSLPTPSTPYDTVVADLAGPHRPDSLRTAIMQLTEHLSSSGTLLLLLDGWPRLGGVTDTIDLGTPTGEPHTQRSFSEATRTGIRGYRSRLSGMGFEGVELYGMVPDSADPSYVIPVDDEGAIHRLLDTGRSEGTAVQRLVSRAAGLAHDTGVLDRSWPAYLAVCHVDGDATGADRHADESGVADGGTTVPDTDGLVTRGGGRSTVLIDDEDGSLAGVTKVPHRRAHADFALDECRTMRHLREKGPENEGGSPADAGILDHSTSGFVPIRETIPDGTVTMTRFGPTYSESPATGAPLSGAVSQDPERFRRILEVGFDWLARLQSQYGTEPARWSPAVVRDELRFESFGLEPPRVDDPIRLFRTPVHGDFHPKNVFVDGTADLAADTGGSITAVIDWELGDTAGNPIVDPGFFALQTARLAFGGLEAGLDAAFTTPGPHADALRDVITEYCAAVGIEPHAFVTCLPAVWIHRLRRCAERGATASYSARAVRRANDVRLIWDRQAEIESVLGFE